MNPSAPDLKIPERKLAEALPDFHICPACREIVRFPFVRRYADLNIDVIWLLCECGTLFQAHGQDEFPAQDRVKLYQDWSEDPVWFNDRSTFLKRIYVPLMEDMQPGRKFLEYRYAHHVSLDWMRERGWLPYGVDECEAALPGDHQHQSCDFMDMALIEPWRKFNLIWLTDCIQKYEHPFPVLAKAYSMLEKHGLMFVSAPDTDFIHRLGPKFFGHFDPSANRLMMRGESFARLAERVGFNTIFLRKSDSRAGLVNDQFHWIGQRK